MKQPHALITGVTKGIGHAISRHLAAAGCWVTGVSRSAPALTQWQREMTESFPGLSFNFLVADLGDQASRADLIDRLRQENTPYTILVNNAGIYLRGPLLEEPVEQFARMWQVNVQAPYALIRALVPGMVEREMGHVFNICSVASRDPQPGSGAYSATKAALYNLTRSLRAELRQQKVSVTAILPGQTWSASWDGVSLPEHRLMQSDDIGAAVVHAWRLAPSAVVEEITMRPQQGDWSPD